MSFFKINDTEIKTPQGCTWNLQDLSSEDFGRTLDGIMHKDIVAQKRIVLEDKKHELNVDSFLDIVKNYSEIPNLTIDILNEFIDKIVVYHSETINGMTSQRVEIFYKLIGNIQIPKLSRKEEIGLIKYFGRAKKEKVAC